MDIPADILDELKCSSCELYLSRGPVYLRHDGAAVCGRCYTPKRPATRNEQYEALARLHKYPCKNRDLGCRVTVPYVEHDEEITHEEVCEHRQYVCPVLGSNRCDWLGPRATMEAHCRAQHPDSVLGNPCSLSHDISKASVHNYIISAFHVLFLLHTKVCVTSGKIFHAIRLLGESVEAVNFFFMLDIKRGIEQLVKTGQVAPQGCLAIQEPTSLAVNTNSLLDVLGGFDGTTFTVTVKRRVDEVAGQVVKCAGCKMVVLCAGCAVEVTVLRYRGKDGWRCKRCAPARRACENQAQGCHHEDINTKCSVHELDFCEQRTQCYICDVDVSRGSLSAHYRTVHQDITHRAGSTWRATQGDMFQYIGKVCLVSSAAGTAVCNYRLHKSQFELSVYSPLLSEQLSEYRCDVRLTDPDTGFSRTFTPKALYDVDYDWDITVNKEEFTSHYTRLDVCVDIRKAESQ